MACTRSDVAAALRSSPEKTQYAKLSRLIIDGGRLALKRLFDGFHPPANLQASLYSHLAVLQDLLRKRTLKADQWDLLFPRGASPESKKFDITLLFILLRNICGLRPPASGWDSKPPDSDKSREANMARVKWFRNLLAHQATTGIDQRTFETYWSEVSAALGALGIHCGEILLLKQTPFDEEQYMNLLLEWKRDDENVKQMFNTIMQKLECGTPQPQQPVPQPGPCRNNDGNNHWLLQQCDTTNFDLMCREGQGQMRSENMALLIGTNVSKIPFKQQDPPIERVLEVSLEEVFFGTTKRFKITRQKIAPNGGFYSEQRQVDVPIKPGLKACSKIKFSQLGDEKPGVIPADIIFVIQDKPHRNFKRDSGNNLLYTARISREQARLGCTVNIPLIEDPHHPMRVTVSPGTQSGMQLKIPGEGMPNNKNPAIREALIVEFDVEIPTTSDELESIIWSQTDFFYLT